MRNKIPINYIDTSPVYEAKPITLLPAEKLPDDLKDLYGKSLDRLLDKGDTKRAQELLRITWLAPSVEKHFEVARMGRLWPRTTGLDLVIVTDVFLTAFLFDLFIYSTKKDFILPSVGELFGKSTVEKNGRLYNVEEMRLAAMHSVTTFLEERGRELRRELPSGMFGTPGRRSTQIAYLFTLQEAARLALQGIK